MKTIILTAIIAFTVLSTEAKPLIIDYVLTDDGVRYFERVKYGVNENYMIGITEAGEKVKFSKEDITSYRKNGDVYKKTKLIGNSKDFNDCVFMKLLQTRHGFSLYLYDCIDSMGNAVQRCFVYKGDQLVLEVDSDNYLQIINFFEQKYQ
jgi:hypothetical protein